jgi:hypothetical protein
LKRERRLLAFVVRRDALERVDFGPVKPIKEALDRWRLALQRRFRTAGDDDLGATVRQLLWQPLEKHLHGAKVVLISPDSDLARVPFAALPGSKKGTYLLEEVVLAVVPVPQLLPELLAARPAAEKSEEVAQAGGIASGAIMDAQGSFSPATGARRTTSGATAEHNSIGGFLAD